MGILIGIILLSILMIIHELGHFLTGLKLGFKILEFNLFMGPVLFSREHNGILYSIKAFPIGASVRFVGEEGEDDPSYNPLEPGMFMNRPKWARAIVIGTGPAVNLLAGVLAFLIMFSTFGYSIPVIAEITQDTLAAQAGLVQGDRVIAANGKPVRTTLDYTAVEMFTAADQPVTLTVRSQDEVLRTVTLTPKTEIRYRLGVTVEPQLQANGAVISAVDPASNNGQPVLLVGDVLLAAESVDYLNTEGFRDAVSQSGGNPIEVRVLRDGETMTLKMQATRYEEVLPRGVWFATDTAFLPAVEQSFQWSWSIVKVTLKSIGAIFTGQAKAEDTLSGPVGVVSMVSTVVEQEQPLRDKIYQLLWLFALISVSLGFMNLLPIPPLDGHHLVLIAVEAVRRKRLKPRTQTVIGVIGLALIAFLGLAGLFFDVLRLVGG